MGFLSLKSFCADVVAATVDLRRKKLVPDMPSTEMLMEEIGPLPDDDRLAVDRIAEVLDRYTVEGGAA